MTYQSFLIMTRTSKGPAACAVIDKILTAPNITHFKEFLDSDHIEWLKETYQSERFIVKDGNKEINTDTRTVQEAERENKTYKTLELFAYGTYNTFKKNPNAYLKLKPPQLRKLKQLTIVTLASQSTTKILNYKDLQKAIDIKTGIIIIIILLNIYLRIIATINNI